MGSLLRPTLADILMIAFEEKIVKLLISSNVIKFYSRCVDDKLVLIKPPDIKTILNKFNSFPSTNECMYVCICMYMYVCMYVCMYACMYVCMHVCKLYLMTLAPSANAGFRGGRHKGGFPFSAKCRAIDF